MIAIVVAAAAGLVLGLVVGVVVWRRVAGWTQRDWVGMKCHRAAARMARFFGNGDVLRVMAARVAGGHRFDRDKLWRQQIENVLRDELGVDRGGSL